MENRRQKTEKNICFIFLKLIFFWRARRGKIGGEKNEKKNIYTKHGGLVAGKSAAKKTEKTHIFLKTYIFWRAGRRKIGDKKTAKI